MTTRDRTKLVREGGYVAEVPVQIIESDDPWSPYLSVDDVRKLDAVRDALRRGDLIEAQRIGRVYRLTPLSNAS